MKDKSTKGLLRLIDALTELCMTQQGQLKAQQTTLEVLLAAINLHNPELLEAFQKIRTPLARRRRKELTTSSQQMFDHCMDDLDSWLAFAAEK